MDKYKVKLTRDALVGQKFRPAGSTVTMSRDRADLMVARGHAEYTETENAESITGNHSRKKQKPERAVQPRKPENTDRA